MHKEAGTEKFKIPNEVFFDEVGMLLGKGHNVEIKAPGNSMLPFIRGNRDGIELGGAEQICRGDIVLAECEKGRFIIHRVMRRKGEELVLMGDGNLRCTESCRTADVIAKVVGIKRGNRRISCESTGFRAMSWLWCTAAKPIRRPLLALYKIISKERSEA